jgi:hypothetical protein
MRLRKTYQGRLPDNKILNNVSNSATDTYSCKQINEMLVFEEKDPTVPEHVKNISEQDIKRWDEGAGGVVEESDPTVPAHVKAITQADIDNWNNGTGGSSTGGSVILNKDIITISTNGTPTIASGDTLPLNKTVSVTGDKLIHDKENYQIVIGPGVTKVKLSFTINGRSSSRQWYAICRTRDGVTGKIGMDTIGKSGADQYTTLCMTDKILDVLEGDKYWIKSFNTGSAVLNADIGSGGGTYMTMEVVEPSGASTGGGGTGTTTDFNTNWVNAELTADFKLYNDASYCRYAKVGNLVNIQFVLSPAKADNVLNSYTETTAFVLPEEYRPSQNLTVLCQGTDTNVFVVGVNTSGNVYLHRYRSGNSLSATPPGPGTWLPCNITYMIDSGTLIVGGANAGGLSVDQVYPIGSVFISAVDRNPGNIFLGTQWERFGKGRTLVGVNEEDEDFATAGLEGGHKSLQNHTHTISNSGAHMHATQGRTSSGSTSPSIFESLAGTGGTRTVNVPRSGTNGAHTHTVNAAGDGDSGNLQPFITVFMWVRTA